MIREHPGDGDAIILEYCCDFCGYSTTHNKTSTGITPIMECDACGRHVCSGHRKFHKEPWVVSHRGMYCLECWEIGKKHRDSMMSMQNQAWEKENDLRLKWHREGKQNRRQKLLAAAKKSRDRWIARKAARKELPS